MEASHDEICGNKAGVSGDVEKQTLKVEEKLTD